MQNLFRFTWNKSIAGEIKFLKKEANIWIRIGISAPYRERSETRSVMNLLHLQRICYTCNEFVSPATNLFHLQQICYTCNKFVSPATNLFHLQQIHCRCNKFIAGVTNSLQFLFHSIPYREPSVIWNYEYLPLFS